jgi:ribosome maturation factor RimP
VKRSERQIADLLEPTITALGLELWGVEHISQGRHSVLRIYIDNPDGISIEDCERVSRQVSAVLDVEDPIAGEYNLEVSSPGADRRLFSLEQFNLYVGNEVSVRLRTPIEGRRKLQGRISEVTENTVCLEVDGVIYQCPFEAVEKANLVF